MALTSGSAPVDADKLEDRLKESSFEIFVKPQMAVGVVLSQSVPPKVIQLLPCSPVLGKLFINDVITAVDDKPVKNTPSFIKAIRAATDRKITIKYKRYEWCSTHTRILPIPRPGWESFEIDMHWRKAGMPVGILVHHDSYGRVVISMVQDGTVASKIVKPGDVLLKINDQVVQSKKLAKQMIFDNVSKFNSIKLTMERQLEVTRPKITTSTESAASKSVTSAAERPMTSATSTESAASKSVTSAAARPMTSTTVETKKPADVPSAGNPPKAVFNPPAPKSTPKAPIVIEPKSPATPSISQKSENKEERYEPLTASESTSSTAPDLPKRIHKPGPKLPNCDFCLPKDVLTVLDANKDFFKNDHDNPSILRNTGQQRSGQAICLTIPKPGEEDKIAFDFGEGGPLKHTPRIT